MQAAGYPFHDPLYSLLFASGDFLPELRADAERAAGGEVANRCTIAARMAEMFIGGESLALPERERKTIENPASGQPVDTVPVGTAEDVDRAVAGRERRVHSMVGDQRRPARRDRPPRRAAGRTTTSAISRRLLTDEQGKPLRESRLEIHRFVLTLEHYAGMAKNLRGAYVPNLDKDTYGLVTKRPLGVVGAIVPVELPDHAAGEQARARARRRQHDGGQAGRHDAADDAADRRAAARGRAAQRRLQRRHGPRLGRRRGARQATRSCARSASPARRRSAST